MNILKLDHNGNPMPVFNPGTIDPIIVDGTNASTATSTVISAIDNVVVRLWAADDCYIKIAGTPIATDECIPLSGGAPEHMIVERGNKIAVLGAKLYISIHQG